MTLSCLSIPDVMLWWLWMAIGERGQTASMTIAVRPTTTNKVPTESPQFQFSTKHRARTVITPTMR